MMVLMSRYGCMVGIGGVLLLAMLSCGTGGALSGNNSPMTLEALHAFLGIPSNCGTVAAWEGTPVTFRGYVDPDNIFDRQRYPDLPYEKFRVIDRQGKSIEVWVKAKDSRPVFARLYQKMNSQIIIRGRLAAVKMPMKGKCRLGAKVWINDPSQIQ